MCLFCDIIPHKKWGFLVEFDIDFDSMVDNDINDVSDYFIDLNCKNDFLRESRLINVDADTLSMYKSWIKFNNKYYYFKEYNCFEELLMEVIFRREDVPVVSHHIVRNDGGLGLISDNFRKPEGSYMYYEEVVKPNFVNGLTDSFSYLDRLMFGDELSRYRELVYRIISIDVLFGQCDHYGYNVLFELCNGKLNLAPMFDNGYLFYDYSNNYHVFNSCFDYLEFVNYDEHTFDVLSNNGGLVRCLEFCLDYLLDDVFDEMESEFKIKILRDVRDKISNYCDRNKRNIEKTLEMVR